MKALLKQLLPLPVISAARAVRKKYRGNRPVVRSFAGTNAEVLQCCIAYNAYGGYCVPLASAHRPAAQMILSGDVWERETIQFIANNVANGDIVHAGTYFGDFLPPLSRSCSQDARVWAFEPNRENYRCSTITISLNFLENVEVYNLGLGVRKQIASMRVFDPKAGHLGGGSRICMPDEANNGTDHEFVSVGIVRLDDVVPLERKVSIIHLDVEGFEQSALQGALQIIKRCRPILILETLPNEPWLAENILSLGYRVQGTVCHNTILTV